MKKLRKRTNKFEDLHLSKCCFLIQKITSLKKTLRHTLKSNLQIYRNTKIWFTPHLPNLAHLRLKISTEER